jgi:hypothetical protein
MLEGGVGEPASHPLAEILHGADHAGELHALVGLHLQLPLLA